MLRPKARRGDSKSAQYIVCQNPEGVTFSRGENHGPIIGVSDRSTSKSGSRKSFMNRVTDTGLKLASDIFGIDRSTEWPRLRPPLRGFGREPIRFPGLRNVRLRLTLLHPGLI